MRKPSYRGVVVKTKTYVLRTRRRARVAVISNRCFLTDFTESTSWDPHKSLLGPVAHQKKVLE